MDELIYIQQRVMCPACFNVPQRSHFVRSTALTLRVSRFHGLLQYKEIYFTMFSQLDKMNSF